MLTKIFGSNSIFSLMLLIILTLVLWGKIFITDPVFIGHIPASPFYNLLCTFLGDFRIIASVITIGLVVLQSLLLNNVLVENEILPKKTYLFAFLFVILSASFGEIVNFNPILISFLFLTFSLTLILKLYDLNEGFGASFNTGLLISLASMFWFPAIIFILFVWMCFIIFRLFSWREWLISFIGLLVPYLFLGTYYYWKDVLPLKITEHVHAFGLINLRDLSPAWSSYIFLGIMGLLVLFAFFRIIRLISEKAIRQRKMLSAMIWLFIMSYLSFIVSPHYGNIGFMMLTGPAAVLLSVYFSSLRNQLFVNISLFLMLIIVIFNRVGIWDSVINLF